MKKTLLTLSLLVLTASLFAQGSIVNFFTDDGQRFHLFLNGQSQNQVPQTNVRVENLTATSYKLRIVFENKGIETIDKPFLLNANTETNIHVKHLSNRANTQKKLKGFAADMKKGFLIEDTIPSETLEKYGLRMISQNPISNGQPQVQQQRQQNYNQQTNVNTGVQTNSSTQVSSTTTQTTTVHSNNPSGDNVSIGINMNLGGVGANVNVNESYSEHHTTTTTTTHSTNGGMYVEESAPTHFNMPGYNGPIGCPWPMSDGDFASAKGSVASKSFEDSKLTMAKQIFNTNCMTSSQVRDMMNVFDFEDSKLEFAKFAYGHTFDLGNYYKVNDAFDFESSIDELNQHIQSR